MYINFNNFLLCYIYLYIVKGDNYEKNYKYAAYSSDGVEFKLVFKS